LIYSRPIDSYFFKGVATYIKIYFIFTLSLDSKIPIDIEKKHQQTSSYKLWFSWC